MIGFRTAFLLLLIAVLAGDGAQADSLGVLLRRVRQAGSPIDVYLEELIAKATKAGKAHIDRAIIIGLDGKPLTSSNHPNALQLTHMERDAIASAMITNRFDAWQANGLYAEGVHYRFMGVANGMVNAANRDGTITMEKGSMGIIVAHSPKGGMSTANEAVNKIVSQMK